MGSEAGDGDSLSVRMESGFSGVDWAVSVWSAAVVSDYRISGEAVRRGSYITFCPPDTEVFRMARRRGYIRAGFCPENYSGLMKFVAGIPGDNYRFTDEGLLINGRLLGGTRPLWQDGLGQPLPVFKGEGRLKDDEYILIGNAVANSFDARYYGIVRREHIRDVVKPIWIEE